jgi:hypothetical protein
MPFFQIKLKSAQAWQNGEVRVGVNERLPEILAKQTLQRGCYSLLRISAMFQRALKHRFA